MFLILIPLCVLAVFAEVERGVLPIVGIGSSPKYPNIQEVTDHPQVFLVEEQRSELLSVMQCWKVDIDVPTLLVMEELIQYSFDEKRFFFLEQGVDVRAIVDTQRVCLLWSGIEESLSETIPVGNQLLWEMSWNKAQWAMEYDDWQASLTGSFSQSWIHQLAQDVLLGNEFVVDWKWNHRQLNLRWRQFLTQAQSKVVIVGHSKDFPFSVFEQTLSGWMLGQNLPLKSPKATKSIVEKSDDACFWVDAPGYSQSTLSFHVLFEDSSPDQLRYIAEVLGGGIRGRLGQVLREEQGLVYNIGARVQGAEMIVEYTVDNGHIFESQILVEQIVNDLDQHWITEEEWRQARGQLHQVQYQLLEDYKGIARMVMAYTHPQDWSKIQTQRLNLPWQSLQRSFKVKDGTWLMVGALEPSESECSPIAIEELLMPIHWDNF